VRRLGPRPLELALEAVATRTGPLTTLARLQARWPDVAGDAIAAVCEPISERAGIVTVACDSAVWASELSLMEAELTRRARVALAPSPGELAALRLRFVVGPRSAAR
jgi:predicted nucleic acid-binding Zn ribbon protein